MMTLYRIWWIPQLPGPFFNQPVSSVAEGKKILEVLALYDQFQLDNNIKPDYANTGGLEIKREDQPWEDYDEEA